MRRTLPVLLTATLLFAACGSDGDSASDGSAPSESTDTTGEPAAADGVDSTVEPGAGSVAPASDPAPPATNPDKPAVEIPETIPTELQVTVIEPGSGPEAAAGDTVVVDYVGVRSKDGVEFDNSFDRFEPFPVVLGQGNVIPGWDQGLVGAQAGSRLQLDIPSDLAYGAEARGEIIGENEALTFLIDVRSVSKPTDAPTEPGVPVSVGAEDTSVVDLREGDGEELQLGQTGIMRYVLYRGDNLVELESNWTAEPAKFPTAEGAAFPGLTEGLPGLRVGGRRAIVIPPADGFGPDGNPQLGLPAGTDMILVVDLLGVSGTPD